MTDMKFDIIVGNPPYNNDSNAKMPLWPQFVMTALSFKPSNILFITPTTWAYGEKKWVSEVRSRLSSGLVFVDLGCSKHFTVGEDISSWHWNSSHRCQTTVITNDGDNIIHDFSNRLVIPRNALFVQIEQKVFAHHPKIALSTCKAKKKQLLKAGEFLIQYSASQTLYTDVMPSDYFKPKVFINRSGHYWTSKNPAKYIRYLNAGVAGALAHHSFVNDETEGRNLVKLLQSKLYIFLMQFNSTRNNSFKDWVGQLPLLDLSKTWTDEELYNHFQLTPEEIAHIEEIVK